MRVIDGEDSMFTNHSEILKVETHPDIAVLKIYGSIDIISRGDWVEKMELLIKNESKKIIFDCNDAIFYDVIDGFFLSLKNRNHPEVQFAIYAKIDSDIVELYYNGLLHGMCPFVLNSIDDCISYFERDLVNKESKKC
jgi:hypothetical protein